MSQGPVGTEDLHPRKPASPDKFLHGQGEGRKAGQFQVLRLALRRGKLLPKISLRKKLGMEDSRNQGDLVLL